MSKLLMQLLHSRLMSPDGSDADGGGEALGTGNDARVALLNGISDGVDRSREEELADVNDDDTTTAFKAPAAEEEDAEAIAAREAEETESARLEAEQKAAAAEAAPAAKRKFKVNGREIELTEDEITARVQKVESADSYLAEAKRLRDEAAQQNKQPSAQVDAAQVDDDLALARAIQMGTEEEAVAALRKIKSAGPSPDDLNRTVDARLSFKEAIGKFNSEYEDIVTDKVLHSLAQQRDQELLAAGDTRSYLERYRAIGNDLRAWKQSLTAQPTNDANLQSDKLTRKAAAPAAPKAAAGKTQTSVEEEKEESTSDVIAKIAAARGGPQWMAGQR